MKCSGKGYIAHRKTVFIDETPKETSLSQIMSFEAFEVSRIDDRNRPSWKMVMERIEEFKELSGKHKAATSKYWADEPLGRLL
jgi:hypothetical protein